MSSEMPLSAGDHMALRAGGPQRGVAVRDMYLTAGVFCQNQPILAFRYPFFKKKLRTSHAVGFPFSPMMSVIPNHFVQPRITKIFTVYCFLSPLNRVFGSAFLPES